MNIFFRNIIIVMFIGLAPIVYKKVHAQNTANYFKKIEVKKDKFKLVPVLDSAKTHLLIYPQYIPYLHDFQDSVSMLKSLLSFEGDTSICSISPSNWPSSNPQRTNYFVPDSVNYAVITIEIEALFIFNLMIEPKQFYLASYPRLQAKKIGAPGFDKMFGFRDERLKIIYDYYWVWLKKCEDAGTFNIGYYPLDKTGYSWL